MSATGQLRVRAYTSDAQLPLRDVAVVITAQDRTAIAMRLTDQSGLTKPIEIPVPEFTESQEPGAAEKPYTCVNLYAHLNGFEQVVAEDIQIFAGTTTIQDLEMIPLSEYDLGQNDFIYYDTPPQDL